MLRFMKRTEESGLKKNVQNMGNLIILIGVMQSYTTESIKLTQSLKTWKILWWKKLQNVLQIVVSVQNMNLTQF